MKITWRNNLSDIPLCRPIRTKIQGEDALQSALYTTLERENGYFSGIHQQHDPVESRQEPTHFIRDLAARHLDEGRYPTVITRFPPEPNGYPHLGHAKSIVLNFGLAERFGGRCHLRFDDTNPETESVEYVEAIQEAVRWMGYSWGEHLYYASDYFEPLYAWAQQLIREGKAYVDEQSEEDIRANRGTVTEPGKESPWRNRSVEENLTLFERMRNGEFPDGALVLRAKIDMAHPNMKLRDPVMYRIRHAHHYRRGNDWCIFPLYDWAHGQSDAIEGITHSVCTLEFDVNRPLYDWYLDALGIEEPRTHQYEFARLNLDYTVMSKRKLLKLVEDKHVAGWDDPRMPTLAGQRRRGVTPEAIRAFCEAIGVTKTDSRVDLAFYEHAIRTDLNARAPRVLCVLDPLKVDVTNVDAKDISYLDAPYWPHDVPRTGSRALPLTPRIFIEKEDFSETPPKGWHRLSPGALVRLRHAFVIRCTEVVRDETGVISELKAVRVSEQELEKSGEKVKGVIHWVSTTHSQPCEVRLYDRLFSAADPEADPEKDFREHLNPASLVVFPHARIESSVLTDPQDTRYQFERQGYFWQDPVDSRKSHLVFNRIVSLRDSWAKAAQPVAEPAAKASRETPVVSSGPRNYAAELNEERSALFSSLKQEGLGDEEAFVLAQRDALRAFFERVCAEFPSARTVGSWAVHEVQRLPEAALDTLHPAECARILTLLEAGEITSKTGRDVLLALFESETPPDAFIDAQGVRIVRDASALQNAVRAVLEAHPDRVAAYRSGKKGVAGFFMGNVMKANPNLDPKEVQAELQAQLDHA